MAQSNDQGRPPDTQVAAGALHWGERGNVTEVGSFKRRSYASIVFDSWTKTTGTPNSAAFVRMSVDLAKPIYLCRYLIIRLPFRVRLSEKRSFGLGHDGIPIVTISNSLSIKNDAEWAALITGGTQGLRIGADPYTWAFVYIGCGRIKDDRLQILANDTGDLAAAEKLVKANYTDVQIARTTLNRFIVSYWNVAGETIESNRVRLLNDSDMLGEPHLWLGCISNVRESPCAFSSEWQSFPTARKPAQQVHLFGERNDLPATTFDRIDAALSKESDYPSYYFAFAGEGYMRSGDYQNALLYFVMAFESAHQHFLEFALANRGVPEPEARSKDLHMRAGIMSLVKFTLHLFLTATEQPSEDAIEKTKRAIELRNSWVHGKRDNKGHLHALQFNRVEINDLVKGVVEVTNALLRVLP